MSNNNERRKSNRREILENFSFYIQIPKLGQARHRVQDVSETGIGFMVESLGGVFTLAKDEKLELHLYLNQSLFLVLGHNHRSLSAPLLCDLTMMVMALSDTIRSALSRASGEVNICSA